MSRGYRSKVITMNNMNQNRNLELLSPKKLLTESNLILLDKIREYSLLENKRIGWNYPLDYLYIHLNFDPSYLLNEKVLDIGCGPGAIHGWLESIYNIDIIGLDLNRWEKDYVDVVGDFNSTKLHKQQGWEKNSFDIIFSGSSLEHQTPWMHYRSVKLALNLLRPGGLLISTVAASENRTNKYQKPYQYNLSKKALEKVYGTKFKKFDYRNISEEYMGSELICNAYEARFERKIPKVMSYISVGASIIK